MWLYYIFSLQTSLQKGSGVYISKAAQSRIILEAGAACARSVRIESECPNRKRKVDKALIGPKTMIRQALIEMFGRAQLSEASACGSHGKKGIRKHVLQALYCEYYISLSKIKCF